ncbi:hypothetical protein GCM10008967_30660 [Bacillus carboniphilus]|uniref:Rubrerythrin diiron-binding domain-containing protein n=1 Tax=Bacillus carboniphilus TaxID=86663 RepID=A0ABN0WI00_9BACI
MYSNQYYYHYNPYYNDYLRQPQLINDIQKAINAEYSAISCYEKLAKMAPTKAERERIMEIRGDEQRHYDAFRRIYTQLTGKQPDSKIIEKCPNRYNAGLEFAIKDEQEAVDFYLDIADKSSDSTIKETFRRAAADEQNHAVWFLYFFQKGKGTNHRESIENFGAKGALSDTALTLPKMLTYALQDEYLAQARYDNILSTFGQIRTFTRIKEAELRHISALLPLFERYQTRIPADTSKAFVTTPANVKAAFAAGVQGEIDNIAMYDKFLALDIPEDVRIVFTNLRDASVNHLAAFERGLARN